MLSEMKTFSEFSKEAQAACVLMYNMSLGHKPSKAPVIELPAVRHSTKPVYHGPKPRWTDDERLELFEEFDNGNFDWNTLGRRFKRSGTAIRAQYEKEYLPAKA